MNTWQFVDDSRCDQSIELILTIERNGDEWRDVIVHKSAEELKDIMRDGGELGACARLALEIVRLREEARDGQTTH